MFLSESLADWIVESGPMPHLAGSDFGLGPNWAWAESGPVGQMFVVNHWPTLSEMLAHWGLVCCRTPIPRVGLHV